MPSRKTNGRLFFSCLTINVVTIDVRGYKDWLLDSTCRLSVVLCNPSKHYTCNPTLFAAAITRQTLISCMFFNQNSCPHLTKFIEQRGLWHAPLGRLCLYSLPLKALVNIGTWLAKAYHARCINCFDLGRMDTQLSSSSFGTANFKNGCFRNNWIRIVTWRTLIDASLSCRFLFLDCALMTTRTHPSLPNVAHASMRGNCEQNLIGDDAFVSHRTEMEEAAFLPPLKSFGPTLCRGCLRSRLAAISCWHPSWQTWCHDLWKPNHLLTQGHHIQLACVRSIMIDHSPSFENLQIQMHCLPKWTLFFHYGTSWVPLLLHWRLLGQLDAPW